MLGDKEFEGSIFALRNKKEKKYKAIYIFKPEKDSEGNDILRFYKTNLYHSTTYCEGSFIVEPGQLLDIYIVSEGDGTSPPSRWNFTMSMGQPNACKIATRIS